MPDMNPAPAAQPALPTIVVQMPPAPPAPKKSIAFWVSIVLAIFLFASGMTNLILLAALALAGKDSMEDRGRLVERVLDISTSKAEAKIAILDIEGLITDSESAGLLTGRRGSTVETVRKFLAEAADDDEVKGVLLRIDSPGGGVTASELIHREISEFKRKTHKPVVALLMDLAASGGYYIAVAADAILAHPTTVTGSIGVILTYFDLSELGEKIGVREVVIKKGALKDLAGFMNDIPDETERKILEDLLAPMYARFLDVVAAGRQKLQRPEIESLADGRVFSGKEAHEKGLVDELGYLEDALDELYDRAGISDARLVTYEREPSLVETLLGEVRGGDSTRSVRIDLAGIADMGGPRFQYLWRAP